MKQTDAKRPFPVLQTPRLRLRRPKETDIPAYLALSQDEDVMRYFGRATMTTVTEAKQVLAWLDALFEKQKGIGWVIADSLTDKCIGDISFPAPEYVPEHARAALGYKLSKSRWGQGLMTEALQQVIGFGFEGMGLNRIEALVDSWNTASCKLLEKNSFVKEAILREYE